MSFSKPFDWQCQPAAATEWRELVAGWAWLAEAVGSVTVPTCAGVVGDDAVGDAVS
jgi:hypothetical protein